MPEEYPNIYRYKRIVQAKLFIDQRYADQIDLDNIAGEACFSKFHFIRLFRSAYGKTPHQYLISVRMEAAKKLLQAGVSVAACCCFVGFDSTTSFTALFRRYTGHRPSTFQLQYQRQQALMIKAPLRFIPACFASQYG